jgi:Cu+-exporting ATPase
MFVGDGINDSPVLA